MPLHASLPNVFFFPLSLNFCFSTPLSHFIANYFQHFLGNFTFSSFGPALTPQAACLLLAFSPLVLHGDAHLACSSK